MENCLSFDGAEGLQQQLYHYQSEVNAWRIKCSQLKMELESVDLVCYFLKQENQTLICKVHEAESLMERNKLELAKVISDIRLQLDSYRDELDLRRVTSNSSKYSSKIVGQTEVATLTLNTFDSLQNENISQTPSSHMTDTASIVKMSEHLDASGSENVTKSSNYSEMDINDNIANDLLISIKRKRNFCCVQANDSDRQSEEGKEMNSKLTSKSDRSKSNVSKRQAKHSNVSDISKISVVLSENEETSQNSKSATLKGWQFHYAALLKYYEEYGTCNVQARVFYECDLPGMGHNGITYHYKGNLGNWLMIQRRYSKDEGRLSSHQRSQLQLLVDQGKLDLCSRKVLPDTLRNKSLDIWSHHYAALLKYYEEYGTCNVPSKCIYECDLPNIGEDCGIYHYKSGLGRWLISQRQAKKGIDNRRLSSEHEAKLQLLVDQGKLQWVMK